MTEKISLPIGIIETTKYYTERQWEDLERAWAIACKNNAPFVLLPGMKFIPLTDVPVLTEEQQDHLVTVNKDIRKLR